MAQTAQKKSISFFPEDLARIDSFPSNYHGDTNLSGKVQEIIRDMHYNILRTKREVEPLFSDSEWMYMRDMLNSSMVTPEIGYIVYLRAQVEDADIYDGLGEKWKVDATALAEKISSLTEFQAYTVVKMVDAWWIEQVKKQV